MKNIYKFSVVPSLPSPLARLSDLANNMWWSWNFDAIELFMRMDRDLWEETHHNPIELLGKISQERIEKLASDEAFLHSLSRIINRFDTALQTGRKFHIPNKSNHAFVAYFSLEFGIHESIPIYSGGLGVLAGDHLKSSSEIGFPLVGVGLLYREGYFRQYLNPDGWQQETYPDNDFYNMPIQPVEIDGKHLIIEVNFPEQIVYVKIWKLNVGRTKLLLLDSNIEKNNLEDREITAQLYGGDLEMRLKQEYVLGMGGIIALEKMKLNPTVYHMNEGHSAFLGLKRIENLIDKYGLSFDEAMEACSAGNVFTTHTPVPAGIDKFPPHLMDKYFWKYRDKVGISRDKFLNLGREHMFSPNEPFSLAVLAIRLSDRYNGVSELHGQVSRKMWKNLWTDIPESEIPITHITNGIHNKTWTSHDLASLFERYLGPRWVENSEEQDIWERIDQIPDAELWRTHERRRERLVSFIRHRMKKQMIRRGVYGKELNYADEVLDPDALTIGFARRFATYKRATLIFRDIERLRKILTNVDKPVQLIFAGKAHPQDNEGKEFIRQIVHNLRDNHIRGRVVFIEDYDMNVARYMLQGVDVWLNNPRRPLEASGTSGMKAAANGGLNLSILDGWWCEGYSPEVGWAIGNGEEYKDLNYQDEVESRALYNLLEKAIIPLFYNRESDNIPRGWTAKMKLNFKKLAPIYNTNRMVTEYARKFYLPATERWHKMKDNDFSGAKILTSWKIKVRESWNDVGIKNVYANVTGEVKVRETIEVFVETHLGQLTPEDVLVQVLFGSIDQDGELANFRAQNLELSKQKEDGTYLYSGTITCYSSGQHGFAARILPNHEFLSHIHETGLIRWA